MRKIHSDEQLVKSQVVKIVDVFTDNIISDQNYDPYRIITASHFNSFSKKFLRPLEANRLYPEFRQFVLRHETELLADIKENRIVCRRAALRTLLHWIWLSLLQTLRGDILNMPLSAKFGILQLEWASQIHALTTIQEE